jgi:hypothetical protein
MFFLRHRPIRSFIFLCAVRDADLPRAFHFSCFAPALSVAMPKDTASRDRFSNPLNIGEARAPSILSKRGRPLSSLPQPNNEVVSLCI